MPRADPYGSLLSTPFAHFAKRQGADRQVECGRTTDGMSVTGKFPRRQGRLAPIKVSAMEPLGPLDRKARS